MMSLPLLPPPINLMQVTWRCDAGIAKPLGDYYTADQMREYANAAVAVNQKTRSQNMNDLKHNELRAAFEAWISAPPYECDPVRYGAASLRPGSYREIAIDLAWQAWQAAASVAVNKTDSEDLLRKAAFPILSPLRSGTEQVVRLSDALAVIRRA